MSVKIVINGQPVEAREGQTVLEAARAHGFEIPTLCYHKDLSPTGTCRMCVVEIEGWRGTHASCVTKVQEGMRIHTHTDLVERSRKLNLELMLANHPMECLTCEANGACELQDLAYEYQVDVPTWGSKGGRYPVDSDPNPFIHVDMNKCIQCRRCIQACAEIQVRDVWGVAERNFAEVIVAGAGTTMLDARCESCGQCVAYCPTGALTNKMSIGKGREQDLQHVTTTCTYCGVGCTLDLLVKDDQVVGVASNPDAPVNGMALCVKGRYGWDFIHHPERLTKPQVRRYLLEGKPKPKGRQTENPPEWEWVEVSWEKALDLAAHKLDETRRQYGADSIGILTSAKCTNEENYLMNKLARQVLGTHNIDHCARL